MYCSIVIPTIARADILAGALDSLKHQTERDFETIVVCDGADRYTRQLAEDYVATYPISWIFNSSNLGLPSARNIGVAKAQGEVLLFLDDDCLPGADWVLHHCKHHRENVLEKGVVVLGPIYDTYIYPPNSATERLLRETRAQDLRDFYSRCIRAGGDLGWFPECGMNSSIKRTTFLASGGYDPALYIAEDLEFGTRLRARGVRMIYEPQALLCHRNQKSLVEHQARNIELRGRMDVYRVREKHQRTKQTDHLLALHQSKITRKIKQRLAWRYPKAVARTADVFRRITDLTGSHRSFRLWSGLISAGAYWTGVKSEGITLASLRELIESPLPILMFHSISVPADRYEKAHRLSPDRLRRFVRWLKDANYQTIVPSQGLPSIVGSRNVMLTFDDGYEDFYSEAFPILRQNEFASVLFVVVNRIGQTNSWDASTRLRQRPLLSLQQLRELQRHGVTIGSHSLTHPRLPELSDHELRRELEESKRRLEDLLSTEVTCFAYPYGLTDDRVRTSVAVAGYKLAMTTEPGLSFWDDPLAIKRIGLSEQDTLADFILKLTRGRSIRQDAITKLHSNLYKGINALPMPANRMLKEMGYWLRHQR